MIEEEYIIKKETEIIEEQEVAPCGYDHCGANCKLCPLNLEKDC